MRLKKPSPPTKGGKSAMTNDRRVYGIGINDAWYRVTRGRRSGSGAADHCPFYRTWHSMLKRCYSEAYLKAQPTYLDCTVCEPWHTFSNFRSWMERQDWRGKHLDKDLLCRGNKLYDPERCAFLSPELNLFLNERQRKRGDIPIGAYWHARDKAYISQCKNPFTGKNEYLGSFDCADLASQAWRERKHEHALRYAAMQTDERIAAALITRYMPQGAQP